MAGPKVAQCVEVVSLVFYEGKAKAMLGLFCLQLNTID